MARIVVCGYMVRFPLSGMLLTYMHHVLGLHRLGHTVVYVEESGWPCACFNPETNDWQDDPAVGLRIVRETLRRYDAAVPVLYVHRETGHVEGGDREGLERLLGSADLLLNLGGVNWLPEFRRCRRRALVDMDPLFTQVKGFGHDVLDEFHRHFSYGVNIGRADCIIPTLGIEWLPTIPPVVPELWAAHPVPPDARFTTIASWSAYGGVEYNGVEYGQKDREFMRLVDVPGRTRQPLELALSGADDSVRAQLRSAGWHLRDATGEVTYSLPSYQAYIAGSRGEFSAAKHAYVATRCGWFSERSVCYLAAGRPVIVQETGFSDWMPTGLGVVPFTTPDDALDAIERVAARPEQHARAALARAQETFSYRAVLPHLLARALD